MVHFRMAKNQTRRNFLRVAPFAAAVSIPLAEQLLHASTAASGAGEGQFVAPSPFQVFTAENMADSLRAFQSKSR